MFIAKGEKDEEEKEVVLQLFWLASQVSRLKSCFFMNFLPADLTVELIAEFTTRIYIVWLINNSLPFKSSF